MRSRKVKCVDCGFLSVVLGFDLVPEYKSDVRMWYERAYGHDLFGPQECSKKIRSHISQFDLSESLRMMCSRHVWDYLKEDSNTRELCELINQERQCPYFFPYNPGYSPEQHLELKRGQEQRRFLLLTSLIGAAVGAGIALLANWAYTAR